MQSYSKGEIVIHEGDRLPAKLYALLDGTLQVVKTATTGKETILRTLPAGEIFAAPALLGDGISPGMVTAECDSIILTIEREALLEAIRQTPEIAFQMLMVFNSRLQQLHDTVHGLVSERAIVRLARLIQYFTAQDGISISSSGGRLNSQISYYQIARSIGIIYEECVRIFKSIKSVVTYSRGGKITVLDPERLEAIANGELELNTDK